MDPITGDRLGECFERAAELVDDKVAIERLVDLESLLPTLHEGAHAVMELDRAMGIPGCETVQTAMMSGFALALAVIEVHETRDFTVAGGPGNG